MLAWFSVLAMPIAVVVVGVLFLVVVLRSAGVVGQPPAPVAPSVGAGGVFPSTITLVQAPAEDTKPLHARIDSLRAQVATLEQQLSQAEEQARFWEAGGTPRLELINASLRRVRDGRHVELVELLELERDILTLRQEG